MCPLFHEWWKMRWMSRGNLARLPCWDLQPDDRRSQASQKWINFRDRVMNKLLNFFPIEYEITTISQWRGQSGSHQSKKYAGGPILTPQVPRTALPPPFPYSLTLRLAASRYCFLMNLLKKRYATPQTQHVLQPQGLQPYSLTFFLVI